LESERVILIRWTLRNGKSKIIIVKYWLIYSNKWLIIRRHMGIIDKVGLKFRQSINFFTPPARPAGPGARR